MARVFGELADSKEGTLRLFSGVTSARNSVNNETTDASVAVIQPCGECVSADTNSTDFVSSAEVNREDPIQKHFRLLDTDRRA